VLAPAVWAQQSPSSSSSHAASSSDQQSSPSPGLSSSRGTTLSPAIPESVRTSKATLETSETLFTILAALNACGYDQDLANSDSVRQQVRSEVAQNVAASPAAQQAQAQFCQFYTDHRQTDSAHDLAQYISLGLYLNDPPSFSPRIREADLPPDATYVLGAVPLFRQFYKSAGLNQLWESHQRAYEALVEKFHDPVANLLLGTDLYLKLQLSGYLGRQFVIFIEPMAAPSAINARNYGDDYFLVLSPAGNDLKLEAIRHTYLHYVLDPYALKRANSLKKLEPLLLALKTAPMDDNFKNDVSLMVTESLIRAVEARMLPGRGKEAEAAREKAADVAEHEGFTLTPYFYDQLVAFEKGPAGVKDSYADWLYNIDVGREKKRAEQTEFAKQASPELLHTPQPQQASLLDLAEQRLSDHDAAAAAKLAQQALDEKQEDPARALFILARSAAASGDMQGALSYFQRTIDVAREPRMVAWSHIYLGRIMDIKEQRDAAVEQYHAALAAGDSTPDTKTAAERGLAQPYAPPASAPR